jgi:predicted nucleotide-binding protein
MANELPPYPLPLGPLAMANPYSKAAQAPMMMPPMGNPMVPGVPASFPGASAQVSQLPSVPPIKSLQNALEKARNNLDKKVLSVRDLVEFLRIVAVASRNMFGEKAALTQHLLAEMKAAAKLAPAKQDCRQIFAEHLKHAEQLFRQLNVLAEAGQTGARSYPSATPLTKKVFIVHGHDDTNWLWMRHILTEPPYKGLGLEPIVIREQAGQSKPILQKFEDAAAESSYAICIFTPDDFVHVRKDESRHDQARPNVIFETGWFVGRLGPSRVLILVKNGTQLHSDFDGVSKIPFAVSIEEQMAQINRELVAAGLLG